MTEPVYLLPTGDAITLSDVRSVHLFSAEIVAIWCAVEIARRAGGS